MSEENKQLDRIRWAARRGMLELDLVLKPYVEHHYLNATEKEKDAFHQLLACEDQELFGWFIQSKPVDKAHQKMVEIILEAKKNSF
ncbi:MAG: succinate dehydrogenase assembly factor 2 family protein [Gammaproteobacteria bacterium]|nr:MAG: succinate dehydrogenase assembly factor 2 family protein [Gammaproteobacteria bacterium]UTW42138.1 succinate dehydrogenase assembly factor 2 [bacterium SCSIO 12844]